MHLDGIQGLLRIDINAASPKHIHAVPINQFTWRVHSNLAFDFGIAHQGHQRETRIARMPERARLRIVAPEIPVFAQAFNEIFRTRACILQVVHLLGRDIKFRRGKERRVIVDDVFLVVVAILARLADSLFFGQMSVSLFSRGQVLFASEVALHAEF